MNHTFADTTQSTDTVDTLWSDQSVTSVAQLSRLFGRGTLYSSSSSRQPFRFCRCAQDARMFPFPMVSFDYGCDWPSYALRPDRALGSQNRAFWGPDWPPCMCMIWSVSFEIVKDKLHNYMAPTPTRNRIDSKQNILTLEGHSFKVSLK